MAEPDITIDGESYDPESYGGDFDDFDFQFGPEVGVESDQRSGGGLEVANREGKVLKDEYGIPVRNYLGAIRPYFDRMDNKMKENLRIRYINEIKLLVKHHPDAPIEKIDFNSADLDIVYTTKEQLAKFSSAENYATIYSNFILIFCAGMERTARYFGFKQAKGFTRDQVQVMPLFRTMTIKMALEYGAGPVEGLPILVQVGGMIMLSMATHVGLQMLFKGAKNKKSGAMKRTLMGAVLNQIGAGGAGGKGKSKKQAGAEGAGAGMLKSLLGGVMGGGLEDILGQFLGGGKKKKPAPKGKLQGKGPNRTHQKKKSSSRRSGKRTEASVEVGGPESDPEEGPKIEEVAEEEESAEGVSGLEDIMGKALPMLKTLLGGKPDMRKQRIHVE